MHFGSGVTYHRRMDAPPRARYPSDVTNRDGATRHKGSKVRLAVDILGHLLALRIPPANAQDRAQVTEERRRRADVPVMPSDCTAYQLNTTLMG
jgi:hypothetical protein